MALKINTIRRKVRIYPSKDMNLTFERTGTFRLKFVTRNSLLFEVAENPQSLMHANEKKKTAIQAHYISNLNMKYHRSCGKRQKRKNNSS